MSTDNVGDMYQKYIDEKIFPPKPVCAQGLVLVTNRRGQVDTDLGTIVYENSNNTPSADSDKILQLGKEFEIGSPYQLYMLMECLNGEKEKYLSIQCCWYVDEKKVPKKIMELYQTVGQN